MESVLRRGSFRRRGVLAAVLVVTLTLGGCCTSALWGCTATDAMLVPAERRAEGKGNAIFDSHAPWTPLVVGKRVLLTPLALGLDFLTWPQQLLELVIGPPPRKQRDQVSAR